MVQRDAAKRAREMASAVASVYQAEGYTPDSGRMEQFHSAAFSQAYEFIPDSALSTVISLTEAESLPLLVAIDGQQFYKLFFGEFEFESSDMPITVCEMTKVKPEVGYVKAEVQYERTPPAPPSRLTGWTFGIDDRFNLTFTTRFDSEDEADDAEKFARALATAMGWADFG